MFLLNKVSDGCLISMRHMHTSSFSAEKHRQTHRDKKITEILESLLSHVEQKIMCEPVIPSWMEGGEAKGGEM